MAFSLLKKKHFSILRFKINSFQGSCLSIHHTNVFHRHFFITFFFSVISKASSMLHHGSVRRVESKIELSWTAFFTLFLFSFCLKNCFFLFHFFSWWKIKFPLEKSNQSETWIGDNKLLVKLHKYSAWTFLSPKKT